MLEQFGAQPSQTDIETYARSKHWNGEIFLNDELTKIDARKGRVVELRYFGGLSIEETAAVLNVSIDTAKRDWRMAKAWLISQL